MTTAILEIIPNGHYTYVESIATIYTAVPENKVIIFTHQDGQKALQHLENQQISLKICHYTEGGYSAFFKEIKNVDRLFVVTLEAYAKETFRIVQDFVKTDFNCPIYYVIHNVDYWFQQSLGDKIRNVFYKIKSFEDFKYRLKVYFYYTSFNDKILKKVLDSGGKFVTLTETVGHELAKYIDPPRIAVVPFSFFDGKILELNKVVNYHRLRVCLPGYVSAVRRDYASIFKLFETDKDHFFRDNIEFDFLGGIATKEGGEQIKDAANHWISNGYVIHIYDKPAVGLQEFDTNLAKADLVLGNMHIQQGANGAYGKSKESGLIFTMIKAAKVGLVPADYAVEEALKSSILTFQNYEDIADILKNIKAYPLKWARLKLNALENSEKFRPLSIYKRLPL